MVSSQLCFYLLTLNLLIARPLLTVGTIFNVYNMTQQVLDFLIARPLLLEQIRIHDFLCASLLMEVVLLVKLLFIDLSVQVDEKDGSNIFDDSVFGKFQNLRGRRIIIIILATFSGREGTLGCLLLQSPKFHTSLTTLDSFIEFRLVCSSC